MEHVDCGGLQIPLWPTLTNHGIGAFEGLAGLISRLSPESAEWDKIPLLANSERYLSFVSEISGATHDRLVVYLQDFREEEHFRQVFGARLRDVSSMRNAGDL